MNNPTYVTAKKIQKEYDVSTAALRKWSQEGRIETIRAPGGKRLYKAEEIQKLFGKGLSKKGVCYARVSSEHQRGDLERQIQDLQKAYPGHEIISDIGSGLNWKRKGFNTILDRAFKRDLQEIVVAHKDRLCRFGYELLENIFKKLDVQLVVHSRESTSKEDNTNELAEDLLSIVTVFVARNNGKRSGENRKRRKRERGEEEKNKKIKQASSRESDQDSGVSDEGGEGDTDEMDGNSSVDL